MIKLPGSKAHKIDELRRAIYIHRVMSDKIDRLTNELLRSGVKFQKGVMKDVA